ncbi:hypothetical protein DM826_09910 [Halonotius aquaticus]|uniref:histidine kinase n=1 Tax=Halonotius aquaticus TaxID=2216978 RepID=A0A3A6Q3Z7_9EURY|nr:PAS domain-containing sensor histidine kinase [Halonotius aquaticus]RJX41965.1 hypothetical protein DM826_09910 [Halonotius aquaticus]
MSDSVHESIVEHSNDGIFVAQDGEIVYANQRLCELTGYEPGELVGASKRQIVAPDDRELVEGYHFARMSGDTAPSQYEIELQTADDELVPVELSVSRVDYEGEPAAVSICRDITDRQQYQQRLEEQRDNLELLNQVVRHDIRNDLQIVVAYSEMLEGNVEEDAEGYLQSIRESARNAVDLTATARDLADVMLQQHERGTIELARPLEQQIESIRTAHAAAVINVEDSIPSVTVYGNEMLDAVFRNLLQNAIQHNDTEVPEISVSVDRDDDTVRVAIADNGPGVPEGQREEIFGKGEKGLESDGSGIGLYLVYTLVDSYGGSVWVEDNEPEGAVFVVELPVADVDE